MASIRPADVVVGVLEEPGVHLHLARQHRLQRVGHVVPGRDLGVTRRQLGVGRDDTELFWRANVRSRSTSHPSVELAPGSLSAHSFGDVMRGMGRARREVDEERLVRHQRLC
jgi:hypothetical protein